MARVFPLYQRIRKKGMNKALELVLIEDDEDGAQRMLKFLRANFENSIRHISDGEEAVRFLLFPTDNVPKIILLDVMLPNVDGIELFQMIRLEPRERNLSVIFLVNSPESKEYLESKGLHPDGFLIKPRKDGIPARI
jgi:CheY-like chemotaxis protein